MPNNAVLYHVLSKVAGYSKVPVEGDFPVYPLKEGWYLALGEETGLSQRELDDIFLGGVVFMGAYNIEYLTPLGVALVRAAKIICG